MVLVTCAGQWVRVAWDATRVLLCLIVFFFNDTATTEIYTLSLHDALPICGQLRRETHFDGLPRSGGSPARLARPYGTSISASLLPRRVVGRARLSLDRPAARNRRCAVVAVPNGADGRGR